jgi:20S proteasome alpha/beta subunit
MSLIICVYIPTGIILSGDSRTTGTIPNEIPSQQNPGQNLTVHTNIVISDSTNKIFKMYDRFGIATFGNSHINNLPIAHFIEQFEAKNLNPATTNELATNLLAHFRSFNPIPSTFILVSGYDNNEQFIYNVDVANHMITRHNFKMQQIFGVSWGGDSDIVGRLLNNQNAMPVFEFMNLQDAIDFSRHLIRTTIDQMRFEPRFPSVGGNIDTLLITNGSTEFIDLKKLKLIN